MANRIFESMAASTQPNELFAIDEREVHSPEWTREMIASLDDEIRTWEQRAAEIEREIPALERQRLECQRDAAVARLKQMQMQARLDAMEGK